MKQPGHPILAFLAIIAVALPLPWHWRARNIATLSIIAWLLLANIFIFINSVIWADSYANIAPGWCDVAIHAPQALTFAIPACSLSQMRRLEAVASVRHTALSRRQRTRRTCVELAFCVGLPIVMVALAYIVQDSRYAIFEDVGCVYSGYVAWPSVVINNVVPSVLSLIAVVYAALAVRWFFVRRLQFQAVLSRSAPSLNVGRYIRLIAFAVVDVLFAVTCNIFALTWVATTLEFSPWRGVEDAHVDFGVISQYIPSSQLWQAVVTVYLAPIYSLLFFIFFGFGEEALGEYLKAWRWVVVKLRISYTVQSIPLSKPVLGTQVRPLDLEMDSVVQDSDKRDRLFEASLASVSETGNGIPVNVQTTQTCHSGSMV